MSEPKKPSGKIIQPERAKANAFPFAYTAVTNPETGATYFKRVVSPQIPDRILMTGNKKELEKFYMENGLNLTAADHRYMKARLHTANQLDYLEKKALQDIYDGKQPEKPELTTKKGYVGFDKIKLSGPQTSGCGCWSCAMSLLLKSRGVDLSEEEIRAFRPEYEAGQEQMNQEQLLSRNRDTFNSPSENGDLIFKVLPNTGLTNVTLMPLQQENPLTGELPFPVLPPNATPEQQERAFQQYERDSAQRRTQAEELYKKKTKETLVANIRRGLFDDRSPVILNRGGGHFVTITGISEDGNRLRVEDSFQSCSRPTQYVKVDDLINKYMAPGMQGLDLIWLKDLPAPEYNMAPESTELMPENPGVAVMDQNGKINLTEPETLISVNPGPQTGTGLLKAQEVKKNVFLDQTEIKQAVGGTFAGMGMVDENDLPEGAQPEGMQLIATENLYLPKKVRLLKDPEIRAELDEREAEAQADENLTKTILDSLNAPDDQEIADDAIKEEPAQGSYDSFIANQKHQLYTQGPDTEAYIANIYAANVIKNSPEKVEQDQAAQQKFEAAMALTENRNRENDQALIQHYPHLKQYENAETGMLKLSDDALKDRLRFACRAEKEIIAPAMQAKIDEMAKLAMPIAHEMLTDKQTSASLALTACAENGRDLVNAMDTYANKNYYIQPNPEQAPNKPDWVEKKKVISDAFTAMSNTGTGKNYLGFRRDRNSDDYNDMLTEVSRYKTMLDNGITPSGMQNKKLITKCMKYATGHMKTRWTKDTGALRFDSTMRILKQVMPEKQFQRLLTRINRTREAQAGDSSYLDKDAYSPMTAKLYAAQKMKEAMTATGSKYTKLCSEALAANLLAEENPRGEKMIVDDPYDPAVKQQLEQRARQLRRDPNFTNALGAVPAGDNAREKANNRRDFLGPDGYGLKTMYQNAQRTGVASLF